MRIDVPGPNGLIPLKPCASTLAARYSYGYFEFYVNEPNIFNNL